MTDTTPPAPTPAQLADRAAEAIRALNHATLQRQPDWEHPGDAYSTVANLSQMAMRLPQALEQINRLITALNEEGHLRSDRGDLDHYVTETVRGLDEARNAANTLYDALDRAHQGLGPLAYQD